MMFHWFKLGMGQLLDVSRLSDLQVLEIKPKTQFWCIGCCATAVDG